MSNKKTESDDYCEIVSQLDAREILRYLNNLGIRNISGEVLKLFITDLKKLIKYDLQQQYEDKSARASKSENIGPERLHSASTFSSRIRSKVNDNEIICNRQCQRTRESSNVHYTYSAPNLDSKKDEKLPRRACSCVQIQTKQEVTKKPQKSVSSNNLIKVPQKYIKRKNDPVALYHYYTSLWAKYKPNVPGENSWSELRWNIRQKMVGNFDSQSTNKVTEMKVK